MFFHLFTKTYNDGILDLAQISRVYVPVILILTKTFWLAEIFTVQTNKSLTIHIVTMIFWSPKKLFLSLINHYKQIQTTTKFITEHYFSEYLY